MDLPIEDERAGPHEYAMTVVEALAAVNEAIVLVGHSLGGVVLPLVAEMRPVRRMIFLAATLPMPGMSHNDQKLREPDMVPPYVGENGGLNKERFYNRCTPKDAEWAYRQLRHQARRPFEMVTPLKSWPAVPISYIACSDDRAVNPEWGKRAARERFGVEAEVLVGSDHSPMISRPDELARLLVRLADQ
jgi:pimeloyl-ACP methyl ester carboxylesterase